MVYLKEYIMLNVSENEIRRDKLRVQYALAQQARIRAERENRHPSIIRELSEIENQLCEERFAIEDYMSDEEETQVIDDCNLTRHLEEVEVDWNPPKISAVITPTISVMSLAPEEIPVISEIPVVSEPTVGEVQPHANDWTLITLYLATIMLVATATTLILLELLTRW